MAQQHILPLDGLRFIKGIKFFLSYSPIKIKVPATSAEVPPEDDKASFADRRSASPPASVLSCRTYSNARGISGTCSSVHRTCSSPTSCEHTPTRLGSPHKASGSLPSSGNKAVSSAPPSSFHIQCVTSFVCLNG